jgi:hypothetical protein
VAASLHYFEDVLASICKIALISDSYINSSLPPEPPRKYCLTPRHPESQTPKNKMRILILFLHAPSKLRRSERHRMYGGQRIRAAHTALIAANRASTPVHVGECESLGVWPELSTPADSPDSHQHTEAPLRNCASWRRHDRSSRRNWTASEPPDVPSICRGVGCAPLLADDRVDPRGAPQCMRAPLAHAQPRRNRHHAK